MNTYAALRMMFEANDGQCDPRVKFLARAPGYTLFLTDKEAVLSLPNGSQPPTVHARQHSGISSAPQIEARRSVRPVRLKFVGADTPAAIAGRGPLSGTTNYFIGNDPKKWRSNVANYKDVEYRSLYPGVNAVFHGDNRRIEFDFEVAPGVDPRVIALEVQGARRIRLNSEGDVVVRMDATRDVVLGKPIVYQQSSEGRREIAGNFVLRGRHRIGFSLGTYDHSLPLVIDPTLVYSTYLGGSSSDEGFGIAVDSAGNAYVTGHADSPNFPTTPGAFQIAFGGARNAFVTKLNAAGNALVYSTYLGGSGNDIGYGIAVDSAGNAYVAGATSSTDFPTANPVQGALGGPSATNAFVTELNPAGNALIYSTYLGGSGTDNARAIAIDSSGNAYVTGLSGSTNFPTANPIQSALGGTDNAFVAKLNAAGSMLVYSTYLGGSGVDFGNGIAVDSSGNAYVTGYTTSINFPTSSAFQAAPGGGFDAFVTKLSATGSMLVYSTYLGGSFNDFGYGIAVDSSGNAYVTGYTFSTNFPTASPFQAALGSANADNAFVSKLNAAGSMLVYSTYLGGSLDDRGSGIALDAAGNAYVTGLANSANFPTVGPIQGALGSPGAQNAFVTKLNAAGSALLFSTYLGGSSTDKGSGIAVDSAGTAYVVGATNSTNFPTAGPFQAAFGGGSFDAFVAKISPVGALSLTISPSSTSPGTAGVPYGPVTFTATGATGTVTFAVTTGALPSGLTLSSAGVLSGTPTQAGTFPFTITATDSIGDAGSQAYTLTIAAGCSTIAVAPSTLASGTVGAVYPSVTFVETGGVGAVLFSETGALPTGMTFVAGVLSGTPALAGSFPITVTATDSNSCTGSVSDTLTINTSTGPSPAMVMDNETITVTDTPTFPDVFDSEKITVTDTVMVTVPGGTGNTATTTAIGSTSTSFDGFSLPTNIALVGTTQVSVNFTVKPSSGNTVPTGTVIVTDGFNDTCSATLTSASAGAGSCALTISQVGSGSTSLTAAYTPDSSATSNGLLASSSSAVTENVVQIVSCGVPPAATTVSEGATTTISFTVCLAGDVNAVPTAVTASCLSNATCTLTVTAVPGKAGAYTVTLSIVTTAGSVPLQDPQPRSGPWPVVLFALSMLLFLWMAFLLSRRRGGRLRLAYCAGLVLALVFAGISGCTSASTSVPPNNTGTPLGAATINVVVAAGNFTLKVPVSVTVTK